MFKATLSIIKKILSQLYRRGGIILPLLWDIVTSRGTNAQPLTSPQNILDAMSLLQNGLMIPRQFTSDFKHLMRIKDEKFDVNEYFTILDHLSIEPGYVLDYVYYYDGGCGHPKLYTARLNHLQERLPVSSHIQIDGTADGYFQYVVFFIMKAQFYLLWHSNYNDITMICNEERLKSVLERSIAFSNDPPIIQKCAGFLDLEPKVVFNKKTVKVKIVVFSKHSGVSRRTYKIRRAFPHHVLFMSERLLASPDIIVEY